MLVACTPFLHTTQIPAYTMCSISSSTCLFITCRKEVPWLMSLISFVKVCCFSNTSGKGPSKRELQRTIHYAPERSVNLSIRFFLSKAKHAEWTWFFPPIQSAPQLACLNSVKGSDGGAGFEITLCFFNEAMQYFIYNLLTFFLKKKFDFLRYFIIMLTGWVPISLFYVHFGVSHWEMDDGNAKIQSEKLLFWGGGTIYAHLSWVFFLTFVINCKLGEETNLQNEFRPLFMLTASLPFTCRYVLTNEETKILLGRIHEDNI